MPWVRLDDGFAQHPKVVGVGPLGIALQVAGLCYSSRYLTDGFIPRPAIPTLLDFSELDEHAFNGIGNVCWLAVDKLVSSGMWEEVDGGYQIHDYLDYQPSRASILKDRADAVDRMRRARSTNVHPNNERTSLEVHKSSLNPVPGPIPGGSNEPLLPPVVPLGKGDTAHTQEETNVSEATRENLEPKPPDGNSQSEKPKRRAKTTARAAAPSLTTEQRDKLVAKWSDALPDVTDRIAAALNHTAVKKAINIDRYVDNWLRNDAARVPPAAALAAGIDHLSPLRRNALANGHDPPAPWKGLSEAEKERQRQTEEYERAEQRAWADEFERRYAEQRAEGARIAAARGRPGAGASQSPGPP